MQSAMKNRRKRAIFSGVVSLTPWIIRKIHDDSG
jgi:hypothetical protein